MNNILTVENVHFSYEKKKQELLKGVSLKIKKGAIYGLLGSNGAGKTTLIYIILGLNNPHKGTTGLLGNDEYKLYQSRIGFLPERPYYHEDFRLREYLFHLNRLNYRRVSEKRINDILKIVNLEKAKDEFLKHFSKGMLHRVGLAQALLGHPELLILDEPMSGLDPVGQHMVRKVILKIKSEGISILITSHNLYEIERISDNIGILHNGRIEEIKRSLLLAERKYRLILENNSAMDRLESIIKESTLLKEGLSINGNRLIFPADDRIYFQVFKLLVSEKIKIAELGLVGPSLEDIVLTYLEEGKIHDE